MKKFKRMLSLVFLLSLLFSIKPSSAQAFDINSEATFETREVAATASITSIYGYAASIERGEYYTDFFTMQSGYINGSYSSVLNTIFKDDIADFYDKQNCDGFLLRITVIQNRNTNYKVYSNNILIDSGSCPGKTITFEIPVVDKSPGSWEIVFTNGIGFTQAKVKGQVIKF